MKHDHYKPFAPFIKKKNFLLMTKSFYAVFNLQIFLCRRDVSTPTADPSQTAATSPTPATSPTAQTAPQR
jgi:hypothetical protein